MNVKTFEVERPVPNLVVIGAQRSSTTSLHEVLGRHPDIFMSFPRKEPCFFLVHAETDGAWRDFLNKKGVAFSDWADLLKRQMLLGYRGQRWFGESSTYYTMGDNSRYYGIPELIGRASPEARLINIVRHPIARIQSHYLANESIEQIRDVSAFVEEEKVALANSLYAYQLEAYLKAFSRDHLLVLVQEEFIANPDEVLAKVHHFLGLKHQPFSGKLPVRNASAARSKVAPERLLFRKLVYRKMMDAIGPDVEALSEILGRPMKDVWDLSEARWCKE